MYSPFFMLETYDIIILPEVDWIHKILRYKFTISCEFGSVQVKWLYMFSSIELEEYVESELSDIFDKYCAWVPGDPFYAYEG